MDVHQQKLEQLRTKSVPPFDFIQETFQRVAPHLLQSILSRRGQDEDKEVTPANNWKYWLKEGRPPKPKSAKNNKGNQAHTQDNKFSALGM
jgi:hypothetical protein